MIAPRQTFIARKSLPPVHQQSAIADIQEAGPSHQQHSAGSPKIEGQKKQMGIPMQCNYIVIGRQLFIGLHQHLQRLRQLLMGQNDEKRCFENTEVKQLVVESLQATPGLRLSEHQINSKIARWLKAAPSKIGKDNGDEEENLSGDE
ncbi:hypothetical protein OUZ56_005403 [Daphnia magna]|uniref:Uncharacterized protein n=1 Tax=Daphnia magna TaxID=35525 RepID=A0ABQ9YSQ0_9CRUS|nr:hypothetical protein OUZ56_005403 [Daphnia magna]